jgi:hypothetical protein
MGPLTETVLAEANGEWNRSCTEALPAAGRIDGLLALLAAEEKKIPHRFN